MLLVCVRIELERREVQAEQRGSSLGARGSVIFVNQLDDSEGICRWFIVSRCLSNGPMASLKRGRIKHPLI